MYLNDKRPRFILSNLNGDVPLGVPFNKPQRPVKNHVILKSLLFQRTVGSVGLP